MNDLDFLDRAEGLLKAVEVHCDRINEDAELDLDNQRVGAMVTIIFPNKSQIVINLQKPLHEIWLAAKSGGYHFRWSETRWTDTKSGRDFFEVLSECASVQSQHALEFAP
jgi:CyaY protein